MIFIEQAIALPGILNILTLVTLKNFRFSMSFLLASTISALPRPKNFLQALRSDANLNTTYYQFVSIISTMLPLFGVLLKYVVVALVPCQRGKFWALSEPPFPEVREESRHTGAVVGLKGQQEGWENMDRMSLEMQHGQLSRFNHQVEAYRVIHKDFDLQYVSDILKKIKKRIKK